MKNLKLFCFLVFLSFFQLTNAQVDLKIDAVGVMFNNAEVLLEYHLNENISLEGGLGASFGKSFFDDIPRNFTREGASLFIAPKYYKSPSEDNDNLYFGLYLKASNGKYKDPNTIETGVDYGYTNLRMSLGFLTGYKWVSRRNLILSLEVGVGRLFTNRVKYNDSSISQNRYFYFEDFNGIAKIGIGYRFNTTVRDKR